MADEETSVANDEAFEPLPTRLTWANIEIRSEGTGNRTQIYNRKTGEQLKYVKAIDIHIEANGIVEAKLTFIGVPLRVISSVTDAIQEERSRLIASLVPTKEADTDEHPA